MSDSSKAARLEAEIGRFQERLSGMTAAIRGLQKEADLLMEMARRGCIGEVQIPKAEDHLPLLSELAANFGAIQKGTWAASHANAKQIAHILNLEIARLCPPLA